MRSSARIFWPLATVVVLADCSTKRAIEDSLPFAGVPHPVVDDVVRFTLAYNQGAAFSTHFGPYQRWVLIALGVCILGALARSYGQIARLGRAAVVGLALVVGGAVGNLLDRVLSERGVVDFIDVGVGATRFYVFNLADVGVSLGAVVLAVTLLRQPERPERAEPA